MSQSDQQNNQSDLLPEAPNNNTQDEAQDPSPITYMPRDGAQDPPPSILHTRRLSIQEHPPTAHTRRVSIQEHPPTVHTRRVSIQEHPLILHTPPILHTRRVSTQEPPPIFHTHRVSTQETAPISNDNRTSTQETPPPISSSRRVSIQETPPIIHSSHFNTRDVPPSFQTRRFSVRRSSLVSPIPLTCIQSVACTTEDTSEDDLPATRSRHLSIKGSKVASRAQVDVPPSITNSPQASIESIDSILCSSQEVFKDSLYSFQFSTSSDDSTTYSIPPGGFVASSSGFQSGPFRRYSQLPIGTRLLHEAKKISRLLSLVLSLFGMAILSLITLGQPWIHFQVPLLPPGDPAGPKTIPINTIFFLRCADISCLREQDHKAYLLDSSWAFFLTAGISSLFLCIILINIIYFTISNLPILDFSNIIISILAGTAMVLGILFYLMQAREFLQEGMTYRLGRSFYLAWTGVFFFMLTGFFSYLNYMNFWFILANQGIWT